MEAEDDPFEKEHHLPKLSFWASMLLFEGVVRLIASHLVPSKAETAAERCTWALRFRPLSIGTATFRRNLRIYVRITKAYLRL